jgi:hypothetical protein
MKEFINKKIHFHKEDLLKIMLADLDLVIKGKSLQEMQLYIILIVLGDFFNLEVTNYVGSQHHVNMLKSVISSTSPLTALLVQTKEYIGETSACQLQNLSLAGIVFKMCMLEFLNK